LWSNFWGQIFKHTSVVGIPCVPTSGVGIRPQNWNQKPCKKRARGLQKITYHARFADNASTCNCFAKICPVPFISTRDCQPLARAAPRPAKTLLPNLARRAACQDLRIKPGTGIRTLDNQPFRALARGNQVGNVCRAAERIPTCRACSVGGAPVVTCTKADTHIPRCFAMFRWLGHPPGIKLAQLRTPLQVRFFQNSTNT